MRTVTTHLKGVTASPKLRGPHLECSVPSQQHTWKLLQNKRGEKPKSCHRSKLKETSTLPWRWEYFTEPQRKGFYLVICVFRKQNKD